MSYTLHYARQTRARYEKRLRSALAEIQERASDALRSLDSGYVPSALSGLANQVTDAVLASEQLVTLDEVIKLETEAKGK